MAPARATKIDAALGPDYTAALTRSDRLRVVALLLVFLITGTVMVVRSFLTDVEELSLSLRGPMGVLLAGMTFELVILGLLFRRSAARTRLPHLFWVLALTVECSLPSMAILLMWRSGAMPADQAIVAPSILFYAVFIVLSTLHLRPTLPIAAGLVCALEHAVLVTLVWRSGEGIGFPLASLITYPVALALVGIASAFVAYRLREHLRAALTEAHRREVAEAAVTAAGEIQRDLMPSDPPDFPGYDIAGWNQPAEETGGDYYDWQVLPDGRLAVSLADVTGHGLGPAIVTAFCRAYARATIRGIDRVATALRRVNGLIIDDLPRGRFVTYVVAVLSRGTGEVDLASAGHGPILIVRGSTGEVSKREANGIPLGISEDAEFESLPLIRLQPGDAIVLMTDGFFEWANAAGEDVGVARLMECVSKGRKKSASGLIHAMRRVVEKHAAGAEQQDDLTAVIIKRV